MIRFFRHIRQSLIVPDNVRKYLLYAVGEILLVVIGILIALQVNNWNDQRLDRLEERELLAQLKSEFLLNQKQLLDKIQLRERATESSLDLLQMISDNHGQYLNRTADSLLGNALPVFTFDPQYGVMNQLVEAGKLSLISNDTLREQLSNWNGMLADVKESELDYSSFNRNDFRPFLFKNADYRSIIHLRTINDVITSTLVDESFVNTTEIGESINPMDISELFSSKEFENYLASLYSHLAFVNSQSYGVNEYINHVIQRIDQELGIE